MGFAQGLPGWSVAELTSSDTTALLTELNRQGIPLSCVNPVDILTVQIQLSAKDFKKAERIVLKKGGTIRVLERKGLSQRLSVLYRRPILVFGLLVFLFLSFYVPSRVFFITIEGNRTVPTNLILEQAEQCGIHFGVSRREIRSEKVKNALLGQIPQLQWVGVNTSGCVATISVQERTDPPKDTSVKSPGNIIATRDGVIRSCTVVNGTQICKIGQAVKAGDVLVSGYTDCGIALKYVRAEAEVYAETQRSVEALTLCQAVGRGEIQQKTQRYSLLIGKKRINFYKDSGISDTSCVKMYAKTYLMLPGNFCLPVALVTETCLYYDTDTWIATETEDYSWLSHYSQDYLRHQMIAGSILQSGEALNFEEDICTFAGQYSCLEIIGQVKNEEIVQKYEQDHRTDR